jgi:hypothetical protein
VPSADDVHKVIDALGLMKSRECDGAPIPTVPAALRMTHEAAAGALKLEVGAVTNQPPACVVFYEVRADSRLNVPPAVRHEYSHMVFRDFESVSTTADRLVFEITAPATGGREVLRAGWPCHEAHVWQVRAINGNGLASAWSEPLESPTGSNPWLIMTECG